MKFRKIEKLLEMQTYAFKSRIMCVLVLVILTNLTQNRALAKTQTEQLDPTFILLAHAEMSAQPESADILQPRNEKTEPELLLVTAEPEKNLPRHFLPDANYLFFNSANFEAAFEQPHKPSAQEKPDEQEVAAANSLFKASMSSVVPDSNSQSKQALSNLIKQISTIKITTKVAESQTTASAVPEKQDELNQITEPAEPNETIVAKPPLANEPKQQGSTEMLSPEVMQKIDQIINQSARIQEPQLLADMLCRSGYLEQAAYFYNMALNDETKTAELDDNDKVWLLMQKAVCLYQKNPQQALQIYKDLISQYPGSPWVQLAQTQEGLVDWLHTQQPKELIQQCRKELIRNNN